MNENINKLIPKAIIAIKASPMLTNGIVPKEFKGYVSSMGASILQAGLLPTLAFYQNDTNTQANSSYLLDVILKLLKNDTKDDKNLITYVIRKTNDKNIKPSVSVDALNFDELYSIEQEISNILIALKLALRTFKFSEND